MLRISTHHERHDNEYINFFILYPVLKNIFAFNGIVKPIPGIVDNEKNSTQLFLSYNPIELLCHYRLVCRTFKKVIDENQTFFGLDFSEQAQTKDKELKSGPNSCYLTNSDFNGIKQVTNALVKQFPVDNHHYIGLGNSPTPFTAYLQIQYPYAKITNLPLGSIQLDMKTELEWKNHSDKFIDYFNRFFVDINSSYFFNGKHNFVLVDFVKSGRSLRMIRDFLALYLTHRLQNEEANVNYSGYFLSLDMETKIKFLEKCGFQKNTSHEVVAALPNEFIKDKIIEIIVPQKVKIFSLLSPTETYDSRDKLELSVEETKNHPVSLPQEAKGGILLSDNSDLSNLDIKLRNGIYKSNYFTLFESKNYDHIRNNDLTIKPTFGNHLRLTAQLINHTKRENKENSNQPDESSSMTQLASASGIRRI